MDRPKPLICVDSDIPYLDDRLSPYARVRLLSQDEFTADSVRDADALMIRTRTRCGAPLLQGSRVRFIATATIGMDQFDLPWCHAHGIETRNAPGCNAPAVAQYVWAAVFHLGYRPEGLKIGVVGHGNVGSIVADWGRRLGAEVRVSDPPLQESGGRPELSYMPLKELAAWCDVMTLHTPHTRTGNNATHHLIDEEIVAAMRPGTLIVNAARGPVSSNAALLPALRDRRIRAAIDCWEGEPHIDREMLALADVATYHIAGYSRQGKQRATRMALKALGDFFGFSADLTGLAPDYTPPAVLTPERLMADFDPAPLAAQLRANPEEFDRMRAAYVLREETL